MKAVGHITREYLKEVLRNATDTINLSNEDLSGVDCSGLDFSTKRGRNVVMRGGNYAGANFSRAILRGVDLSHSDLSSTRFDQADLLSAKLNYSSMTRASLKGLVKGWGIIYMHGCDLSRADFSETELPSIEFSPHKFIGRPSAKECADLSGANFKGSVLRGVEMDSVCAATANFEKARISYMKDGDLSGANLRYANLKGAYLVGTTLRGADLSEADLTDARLMNVDMEGAIIRNAKFRNARYSHQTEWPSGVDPLLIGARLDT